MPKMRGVKPETWTDDKMVQVSPVARLLFIGMWNYACDNGHVENKPNQLKMRVLPADDVDVAQLIADLVAVGCVVDRVDFLHIPALPLHQRIDKRYFTSCDHCAPHEIPEGHVVRTRGARSEPDVTTVGARVEGRKEGSEGTESESDTAGKPRKKPAHSLPSSWRPSDDHIARCAGAGIDVALEADKFRAHAEANDRRQVNWNAAFTQWLLNARPARPTNVHPLPNGEGPNDWMRRRL